MADMTTTKEALAPCPTPKCGHQPPNGAAGLVTCDRCGLTAEVDVWQALPRPTTTADALKVVERAQRTYELKSDDAWDCGDDEAVKEYSDKAALLERLAKDIRALPQPVDGFAAGVAACVEATREIGLFCKQMVGNDAGLSDTEKHWRLREMQCAEIIKKIRQLSPTAQDDNALVEALESKNEAYFERNNLVAALARLFPSGIMRTDISGWNEQWHGCVYIDLPTGQISYHYHDSQAYLFQGLPPYEGEWDGHDKQTVHKRLAALTTHRENGS